MAIGTACSALLLPCRWRWRGGGLFLGLGFDSLDLGRFRCRGRRRRVVLEKLIGNEPIRVQLGPVAVDDDVHFVTLFDPTDDGRGFVRGSVNLNGDHSDKSRHLWAGKSGGLSRSGWRCSRRSRGWSRRWWRWWRRLCRCGHGCWGFGRLRGVGRWGLIVLGGALGVALFDGFLCIVAAGAAGGAGHKGQSPRYNESPTGPHRTLPWASPHWGTALTTTSNHGGNRSGKVAMSSRPSQGLATR